MQMEMEFLILCELPVPEGYELSLAGDQYRKRLCRKNNTVESESGKGCNYEGGVQRSDNTGSSWRRNIKTGSRQDADGNYVFDAAVDFNIPFGYQLGSRLSCRDIESGRN